jgi:Undecaprenyl-phosphate galactose phosphotransferase WbaP
MKWFRIRPDDHRDLTHAQFASLLGSSSSLPHDGVDFDDDDSDFFGEVQRSGGQLLKRGFDLVAASTLLILLSPVLFVIALLVRSDGGPSVFGHTRIGHRGVPFKCLKFRTMVVNADVVLRDLLARDPAAREEWERCFKLKDDIRVTRLGKFMRKTSLDELPQLWNVIRGDMSLVGPRPIIQAELERYGHEARYYLAVKPGITGLWQVSGRSDVDYPARVLLDVTYVKEQCLTGDLVILFRTIGVVVKRRGAY